MRIKNPSKPCHTLEYCPYGRLVEKFPQREKMNGRTCSVFGHHCPVFSVAENVSENKENTLSPHRRS